MPVSPDYMAYGPSPEDMEDDPVERLASDLWRQDHPTMSVFVCDAAMQDEYRARARAMLRR